MTKKNKNNRSNKNSRNNNTTDKVIYESNPESNTSKKHNKKQPPKRKPNDLYKLYDKEIIDQEQYASGERLLRDYESAFKNKCTTSGIDEIRVQKSTKQNIELNLIQNLDSWDRYIKAISSIIDLNTRQIVRDFVIDGKGFTEIDQSIKKRGVAEVRLWYGLKELANYYRVLSKKCREKECENKECKKEI